MRIDLFDYDLPPARIAQRPAERRDGSRLLVLNRLAGGRSATAPAPEGPGWPPPEHRRFRDLAEILTAGDLLVVNDARVLPARVQARRPRGGRVELLFVAPVSSQRRWRVLARPAKRVRVGDRLRVGSEELRIVEVGARGERVVELASGLEVAGWLESVGHMPLPPYIKPPDESAREAMDRRRYQTVFASNPGAVAAPTAGLHFSRELIARLRGAEIEISALTLHVGPGTFRPVTATNVEGHRMDAERYELPPATVATITRAQAEGRRVLAVGTTVVRTLEHAAATGQLRPGAGAADLFIRPGYRFRVVDGMITNFHLPRSTPILLVAALLGRERLLAAYREAVDRGYRFYSYGDAMLLLP